MQAKGTEFQLGLGSGHYPATCAEYDHLYAAWGDEGLGEKENKDNKQSLGVTRITGLLPQLSGKDAWGAGLGLSYGIPDALEAIDVRYNVLASIVSLDIFNARLILLVEKAKKLIILKLLLFCKPA